MKKLLLLLIITALSANSELQKVEYVNPEKFSGLWYEIARTYNAYQKKCVASSVEYILRNEQEYRVYNRCFDSKIGGELIEYKGSAEPADSDSNMAKLDMTYYWIFTKRYYVYYLENDYSAALIADSTLDQLWIMSRTPKMNENQLQNILSFLADKVELNKLIFTPQDEKGRYK